MALVPTPAQVVSAAGNVARTAAYGGVADLRPMPRTLIDDGDRRQVHHYRPAAHSVETGDPVLLVSPLAAPALAFDLRRGCSLVEHLVAGGRPTYLVEYGEVPVADRSLGIGHWVHEVVPAAVREVSAHAGGRPVHVVGWSLGGVFALLAAADQADLPVASIALLAAPFDTTEVPIIAPARPLLGGDGPVARGLVGRALQAAGAGPRPIVRWTVGLPSFQRLVTRPLALATHLDDRDFLAQVEAVDRFTSRMTAYPGRTYGQLYHRFLGGDGLRDGTLEVEGRLLSPASVTAPVIVFGGADDTIAPMASVRAVLPLLTGSRDARFEVVPGGHLGMLTGRAARTATWPVLDEWLAEWSDRPAPAPEPAPSAAARTPRARKAPARKPPASKAPAGGPRATGAPGADAPAGGTDG